MANFTCAEWAARARLTTFARTAGGIICTTSPARDGLTPIGRTDSATTFDSPFSADLLAVWESLFARLWSGRALFDGISGDFCALPLFCGREPFPAVPCQYFSGRGFFVHKILCTDAGETSPPWLFRAVWAESPPSGGDLSAGRRVLVPHARTLEDAASLIAEPGQPDDGGDRRAKAREGAHGAASGARTPTAGDRPPRQRRRQGARPARNRLWPTAKGRGRLCPCPR